MKLAFSIAKRFLGYSKGQTALIMVGIAIGVSVQIFIGLLITGLQDGLIDKTVGSSAHITITQSDDEPFDFATSGFEIRDAFTSFARFADGPVFVSVADASESALIRGTDRPNETYGFASKLIEGRAIAMDDEVLIGSGLADKLEIGVNDTVTLRTFSNQEKTVTVAGIFDFQVAAINESWLVSNLDLSQALLGIDNDITGIEIQVSDVFEADTLAESLQSNLASGLVADNWKAQNAQLLSGLNGQSVSSIMIQVFVLISVVLGIASVLAITVLQKSRQIGILKAMGIDDIKASLIFLFQGLILGFWGAVLGIAFGLGLIAMFTTFARNPDGSALIAISYDIPFITFSGAIAIVSALVASMIPAAKSRKLSPIEVIRNG